SSLGMEETTLLSKYAFISIPAGSIRPDNSQDQLLGGRIDGRTSESPEYRPGQLYPFVRRCFRNKVGVTARWAFMSNSTAKRFHQPVIAVNLDVRLTILAPLSIFRSGHF